MEMLYWFTYKQTSYILVLSLEDEALDDALQTDDEDITKEKGANSIVECLNRLFRKDSTITKYQDLEAFEKFRRPTSRPIQVFLN